MMDVASKKLKVIAPIEGRNGSGTHWLRVGTAHTNKDGSINVYLEAMPKDMRLQLREYDERELREREAKYSGRGLASGTGGAGGAGAPSAGGIPAPLASATPSATSGPPMDDLPF